MKPETDAQFARKLTMRELEHLSRTLDAIAYPELCEGPPEELEERLDYTLDQCELWLARWNRAHSDEAGTRWLKPVGDQFDTFGEDTRFR